MLSRHYKWFVLALLCGAYFFHQADRALFGILTKPIQEELSLSNVEIGWINTALSWTLAAMTMIAGFAGDRFSRKWLITISLIFWSLMTVAMGFVGEWHVLGLTIPAFLVVMFFRSIATGGGESFYGPSAMALLASHHKETRSVAFSIHQGALYAGLMLSGVLAALALSFLGNWRRVFMAFGGAGFLLGLTFIWLLKDNRTAESSSSRKSPALSEGLKAFFLNPSALAATTGFVAIVFVNNAYLFWAPKFAAEKFGVDDGWAATHTMFWHHLAAVSAILLGGVITDCFVKRFERFRLALQIGALLLGAPCLVLIGSTDTKSAMIVMTALYGVFRGLFEVNTHASVFDVVRPEHRSTVVGCMIMCAFFVGGLSGVFMGALADRFGTRGFELGFLSMGAAYLLAAVVMSYSFFRTFRKDRIRE